MHHVSALERILDEYFFGSTSTAERGEKFERLVKQVLSTDLMYASRFANVWMWNEWPHHQGHDVGIDLVAQERDTGALVAIQCKFYDPRHAIGKPDIDSFLSASGRSWGDGARFAERLVVSTTDNWNPHAAAAIENQQIPVSRIGWSDLADSSIDWEKFDAQRAALSPEAPQLAVKAKHELRTYQSEALEAVRDGLAARDRGKLIMACGTGKTFTSLQIALDTLGRARPGGGGQVLFLVPSIALASQTLKEWSRAEGERLRTFVVCSDTKVGKSQEDISVVDLPIPPTTNAAHLAAGIRRGQTKHGAPADRRITVVFSTYQSIDVVAKAQSEHGVDAFDLVICDEAHRTTGVTLTGVDESAFVRVHDPAYLRAAKRLYMTATPRIYDDAAKAKGKASDAVLASMDDENVFGPELYRLGFGKAVEMNVLSDYRVLVLAVDEGHVNRTMQAALTDPDGAELKVDDVAKIIGCWNGLAKIGEAEHDFSSDPTPMRRAVAFSRSIKDSKAFTAKFQQIADLYAATLDISADDDGEHVPERAPGRVNRVLPVAVAHVDGGDNMLTRTKRLDWLKQDTGDLADGGEARILSNAKCLSEGVDVPALDAVLFLNPRKSQVDVVQSVGRVMRRAEGKKYGYIILPIVIPAGTTPEAALRDNQRYAVVWEVLQALRAHDERFNAMVNKIELNKSRDPRINVIGIGGCDDDTETTGSSEGKPAPVQGVLDLGALSEFRDGLYVKIVAKVGSRRYWEDWAKDVAVIAEHHRARLVALLDAGHATGEFENFHAALRANLNESISRDDAIDMLSQHLITAPIFTALFAEYDFTNHNPVSQVMETMLRALEGTNLEAETAALDAFYASVRLRVEGIDNAAGRQSVIKDLYERFFKLAFPRAADQLGIVYTPVEIVDFIIRSVDHLLREEFGASLSDDGVHVLDPFTGTGTFIVRLLQSGLIDPHDLARKYARELHANEIMLLAYYIAAINIESTFHDVLAEALDAEVPYMPFDGIVLTDTFQMHEAGDLDDGTVFTSNSERVTKQKALDIRVIIGNPPYSVGQTSGNDKAANLKYPTLDASIEKTYAGRSTATLKTSLYDSYVRAIRWASDRIGDHGVIGFVTNGGFIDANTADGLRKTLADEFATIYVYNLRGNARTAGEQRRKEAGNAFGGGARTTVAVTFLVRNPERTGRGVVRYRDIGDYLTRDQKLQIIAADTLDAIEWTDVTPNDAGDWINQRGEDFGTYQALGSKGPGAVFGLVTSGLKTNRDPWVVNFSASEVRSNVESMVAFYNSQVDDFAALVARETPTDPRDLVLGFIDTDPSKFSWDRADRNRLPSDRHYKMRPGSLRTETYRPFCRQRVWLDRELNNTVYQIPSLYPTSDHPNSGIYQVGAGSAVPFSVLALSSLPDLHVTGAGSGGQFFARWTYEKVEDDADPQGAFDLTGDSGVDVVDGYRRIDNITDQTLMQYRAWYGDAIPAEVTKAKDRIFAFVYGLLHSPDYRDRFAADLKRSLPRIPRIEPADFAAFAGAGQRLLDLHIGYEDAPLFPLTGVADGVSTPIDTVTPSGPGSADEYGWFAVEKMKWAGKSDKTAIIYNPHLTVTGIPDDAHRYMLGSRSALEWVLDRYQVKTDKASGIVNDPNDWSREVGNPRYILDLIAKVTTVSVETMVTVDALPPLRIVEDQH